jgi:hypothetical protein
MVRIVGARSTRFEQFRSAVVVARTDPEEHAEPTFSRRNDISRNHVYFRPRDLGEWRYRGSDLVPCRYADSSERLAGIAQRAYNDPGTL